MEIILDAPKEIIIREAQKVTADKILINQFTDTGTEVFAIITPMNNNEQQLSKSLILWTGQDYIDLPNNYSDNDIINRIKELL